MLWQRPDLIKAITKNDLFLRGPARWAQRSGRARLQFGDAAAGVGLCGELELVGRRVLAVPFLHLRSHELVPQRRDHGDHDGGQVAADHHRGFREGLQILVGHFALRMVVRVTGQVEHGPRADALVRVPRVARLNRGLRVAHHAVVLHVVHDLQQRLAPQRTSDEERGGRPAAHGVGARHEQHAHEVAADHAVAPGEGTVAGSLEALDFDVPGADVALDGRCNDVEVHVATTRCGGRVVNGRHIAVVAVDVLDREDGVEAERQQPAADEHRDRIPGAVSQFMGRDGADHADHQAGDQHERNLMAPEGAVAGGDGVVTSELLHEGTVTQRIPRARTPDGSEHDHAQQGQGHPELEGQDAGVAELRGAGVVAADGVAHHVERQQADEGPGGVGATHGDGHQRGQPDGVEHEVLEVVKDLHHGVVSGSGLKAVRPPQRGRRAGW